MPTKPQHHPMDKQPTADKISKGARVTSPSALRSLSNEALTESLRAAAHRERKATADLVSHLSEFMRRRLYLELGCTSVFAYLTERLNFSPSTAQNRIDAARLVLAVPNLQFDLESGGINLSQVSIVARGLRQFEKERETDASEINLADCAEQIIDTIRHCDTRQSAIHVARQLDLELKAQERLHYQKNESVVLEVTLSKKQMDALRRAKEILSHIHHDANWSDIIAFVTNEYLRRKDFTIQKATKKITRSFNGTIPNLQSGNGRVKSRVAIPVRTKRQIAQRDRSCQYVDPNSGELCNSTYQLQFDHIKPVHDGGTNEAENLQLLCAIHNRLKFERGH